MHEHLRDLLSHMAWADAVFFHVWGQVPEAAREDQELRERVAHSSGVQENFLKQLRGEDDLPWEKILRGEVPPPWIGKPLPSFAELRDWTRSNHAQFSEFLEGLDEVGLERPVRLPWFQNPPCVVTTTDALVQAAMHTQHHRGQNMTRLKQVGGAAKNVDYIIWLWKDKPEPRW